MPIWLRKLTFNLLKEHYEKKNPEPQQEFDEPITVQRPDFRPTYTTKAPKK